VCPSKGRVHSSYCTRGRVIY